MNNNINLTEILKDCPIGTKLYSPMFGEVDFKEISSNYDYNIITTSGNYTATFTKEGFYYADTDGECTLFPSRDQRDWSKFTAPWLKKERFDPKTLKPFDRVIVWDEINAEWFCANYSHRKKSNIFIAATICGNYLRCIPYNDETKHLVGTTDEAPEFYRYWED